MSRYRVSILIVMLLSAACAVESVPPPPPPPQAVTVYATAETEPVSSSGDAADDPAIWINARDLARSRIVATDKDYGIEVYDLSGRRVQTLEVGRTNNIDLRYLSPGGQLSAVAAASNRTTNTVSLFALDRQGTVTWLRGSEIETGLDEPYGLCMFAGSAGLQVFVNDTDGRFQQWLLQRAAAEAEEPLRYTAILLREFTVPSQPEGCVVDDSRKQLFLGVEAEGVRVVGADARAPAKLVNVADIDGTILHADVEGMSLYHTDTGAFLVVSSQGNHSYAVYDSLAPYQYRGSFIVADREDGSVDGSNETDGLDVVNVPLGANYPAGLLVVQDGMNTLPAAAQNFKLVSWQDIAVKLGL